MKGINCDEDINECDPNPCQNGGTCHNEIGQYRCECPQVLVNLTKYGRGQKLEFVSGFNGTNCELDINECEYHSPSICLHNGSCTNTFGDYNCLCGSVYDGVYATGQCSVNNIHLLVFLPFLTPQPTKKCHFLYIVAICALAYNLFSSFEYC